MNTGTLIAFGIVAVVIGAAVYIATRGTTAAAPPLLPAGGNAGMAEGAQYITAGGQAVGSILSGIGSLINRQAGGTSAGATK